MSEATVYYEREARCPGCEHPQGWHGADTSGCSMLSAGGWCNCAVTFSDHPIVPDPDAENECRVCRKNIDVVVVHGDECHCVGPNGWHCPGEGAEHWASGTASDSECGYCGSVPE